MSAVALKMGETKDGSRNENEIDKPKITGSADMTRRMVCGGLAGMIAKVSYVAREIFCLSGVFLKSPNLSCITDCHQPSGTNQNAFSDGRTRSKGKGD